MFEIPGLSGTEWAWNAYINAVFLSGDASAYAVSRSCHSLSLPDFLPLNGLAGEWPVIGAASQFSGDTSAVLSSVTMPKHCDATLGVFDAGFFPPSIRHIWFKSSPPAEWMSSHQFTSTDVTFHVPANCGWETFLGCQLPGTVTAAFPWLGSGTVLKAEAWTPPE